MSSQYRLKDDWKPVGSSKSAKKLSDWMNAIAKQLNRAEVVSGGTARPSDLGFRIEVDTDNSPQTFDVINDPNDSSKVAIRGGIFEVTRFNGAYDPAGLIVDPLEIDSGGIVGNFTGSGSLPTDLALCNVTLGVSESRWVYLIVGNSTILGELAQGSALFGFITASGAARPDASNIDNPSNTGYKLDQHSVRVLAQVVTDANGSVEIIPERPGGNINETSVTLDSYDGYNRGAGDLSKSLWYDEFGRMSLYDFAGQLHGKVPYAQNGIAGAGDNDMTLAYAYANTMISDGETVLPTGTVDNIVRGIEASGTSLEWTSDTYVLGDIDGVDGMSVWGVGLGSINSLDLSSLIDTWWGTTTVYHTDLDPLTGAGSTWATNDDHDARYTPTASRLHSTLIDIATNPELNVDHDGRYWASATATPAESKNFDTTGTLAILNSLADDTDVTGNSFYTSGGLGVTKGIYAEKGVAGQAGKFTDGTDSTVKLCSGALAGEFITLGYSAQIADDDVGYAGRFWQSGGGSIECWIVDVDYAVNARNGRVNSVDGFAFNGIDGISITNWLGGGIVTGTDIVEIDASDLRPTDKILVRR